MKYMLLIYGNEQAMLSVSEESAGQMVAAYGAYTQALSEAGVLITGNRLRPTTAATSVRAPDGRSQILDGPFAETKEQLAGYYQIDVPDLDTAISWAAKCPGAAYGTIEVRPLWEM